MSMTLEKYLMDSGISDADEIWWTSLVKIPDRIKPMEHQYSGLNLLYSYERAGLYDQTGTGKSLPVQAYALYRAGEGHKVICLMPPVLLEQFKESINSTFEGADKYVSIEVLSGTKPQRTKKIESWEASEYPDILLMTYDLFRGTKAYPGYSVQLKKVGYNVLICDEAQALRNSSSAIHKAVYNFVGGKRDDAGKYALVLCTGTPSHTHLEQNYGLIRLITPHAYGTKKAYERLHIEFNPYSEFRQIEGYKNLDVMTINLYLRARRVEKKDVAKDLPDKIHTVVPVVLDKAHSRLYRKLLNERLLEFSDTLIDVTQDQALRQTALQLISDPSRYSDAAIKNRMEDTLLELVNSIDLERTKVLIFIHFNATADKLGEILKDLNPAIINGAVTNKQPQVDKFLGDESCRAMIAHPKSAGAGLNLQSVCSDVIFYEVPDSPGDLVQAEDRVHRISGTTEPVNVYFLSPKGTLAAKKVKQLQEKDGNINRVVGDKQALLADLFD